MDDDFRYYLSYHLDGYKSNKMILVNQFFLENILYIDKGYFMRFKLNLFLKSLSKQKYRTIFF